MNCFAFNWSLVFNSRNLIVVLFLKKMFWKFIVHLNYSEKQNLNVYLTISRFFIFYNLLIHPSPFSEILETFKLILLVINKVIIKVSFILQIDASYNVYIRYDKKLFFIYIQSFRISVHTVLILKTYTRKILVGGSKKSSYLFL